MVGQDAFICTRRTAAVAALLAVVGLVGRAGAQRAGIGRGVAPAAARPLTVFAAASLAAAFQALANRFERVHPDMKVQFNFAGSPTLVRQIQDGAPADVFASADEASMQRLVTSGAIADTPRVFARNVLQIVVAPGNPKHIVALADLANPGLTIALCGPTVPCGRYAAQAFAKAGVVAPAASQELDVKAVVSKIAMREADAGIAYVTDVRAAAGRVEGVDIPASSNVFARYPIARVQHGDRNAALFIEFVLSSEGQQVLASFGFLRR